MEPRPELLDEINARIQTLKNQLARTQEDIMEHRDALGALYDTEDWLGTLLHQWLTLRDDLLLLQDAQSNVAEGDK